MEIRNFIEQLRRSHFSLVNENGQLILRGDKSRLSEQQIRDIRNNKETIDFIRNNKARIVEWLSDARNTLPDTQGTNVAAIYPLSSLQEGILFQVLYDGAGNAYVQQASCDFEGLDTTVFRRTWEYLIHKHTILRTGIHHDVFKMPVQSVYHNVPLPLEEIDLRSLSAEEQRRAIGQHKEADARRGFVLKEAPLMRITLFRCAESAYTMLWTTHHLMLDGWSIQALVAGFLEIYDGYRRAIPQETTIDAYEDFIRFIQAQDGDEAIEFWRSYMDGADRGCLLPFVDQQADRTKGVDLFREEVLLISEADTMQVQRYVQGNEITLNTLMQGIWATLLTDYTGHSDVLFGIVTHGRPQELKDIEKRVGLYSNILPLRVALSNDEAFADELARLQRQQLSAQQYQYMGLNSIRDLSAVKGELFDTIISFQNFPAGARGTEEEGGLRVANVRVDEQSTNYPLCLRIQAGEVIRIEFIYRESLIAQEWIEKISGHFRQALLQVTSSNGLLTREVELLAEEERGELLQWSMPPAAPLPATTISSRFDEQVTAHPQATALIYENNIYTYSELNERAGAVAGWLIARGVRPGNHVGVCMERSDLLIVAILGILKAGAAYVPLDPGYPADRLAYMIEDSGITHLVAAQRPDWPCTAQLLLLNEHTELPATSGEIQNIDPADAAYLMYTSGSTGTPKGVIVSHNNVVSLVKEISYVRLSREDVLLSSGSPSFDAVTFEYWGMLLNGGCLVMCSEDVLLDPILLKAEIRNRNVTMMWATAGWFNQLVNADIELFATLKTVLVGGDRLPPQAIGRLKERYPALELINGYGPTENTTFSLSYKIDNDIDGDIPIGRPLDRRTAVVLSPAGRLTPVGAIGELCVGGAGLASGYVDREELTVARFREVPALGRLYFTGDQAGWMKNGYVRFVGRKDDQVKIRGFRVEPGEIARVLETAPGVDQALVLVKEGKNDKQLVAYATVNDGSDKARLLDYLSAHLPEYMIPSFLIVLDIWPLTRNGKIDRDKLPAGEEEAVKETAPMDELEAALAAIWTEVLEVESVGLNDQFFDLGGHSLLVIRVISAVRKQLKVELGIRELFENPTIAGLAAVIRKQQSPVQDRIPVAERPAEIPLSFAQERLWFIDKLQGSLAYHMPWTFHIEGDLDAARLESAFRAIVERHEVLRTTIREARGIGMQVVLPAGSWKMYVRKDVDAATWFRQEAGRPFDLAHDHMLRVCLVQTAPRSHQLLVLFHHIAFDGWSISVFVRELLEAYRTGKIRSELPLQYADYAIWQRQVLSGEALHQNQSYWKERLARLEPLQLPTDKPRPAERGDDGHTISYRLEKDLQDKLAALAKSENATMFMTLLAAFNVLLQRYSGQKDICIGTPVAGRDRQELESLIGFFVNTLPLRNTAKEGQTFRQFLQQVKAATLADYSHQDLPFEKMVETLDVNRAGQVNPVFQVMFSLQNMPAPIALELEDLRFEATEREAATALFDLSLDVLAGDGLHLTMNYSTALFEEATIDRLLRHFEQLLIHVTETPDELLHRLDMLAPGERTQLLGDFLSPRPASRPFSLVTELTQRLQHGGDTTAVLHNERATSYAALGALVGRVATSLRHRYGVKKGDRVVVQLQRSERLAASLIALWRCGAVYVPIDAELPEDRSAYIIDDVKAACVITEEFFAELADEGSTEATVDISTKDEAYIIYTSGSTGMPKGVLLRHGGLDNLFAHISDEYRPIHELRMPFLASPGFDISLFQLLTPLINGGASLMIDQEAVQNIDRLVELLRQATFLDTVPGVYSLIADHILQRRLEADFDQVERLFIGGDTIPDHLLQRLALAFRNAAITVTYGPTEGTVFCTDITYSAGALPADVRGAVIGRPLAGASICILDAEGRLQPAGMEGEICIGGAGVAAGYLNNDKLTNDKFMSDPYGEGMLYRTGDVGCWLDDGRIMFRGRNDRQLKINGNRVEPGEIESRIKMLDGVGETVVAVMRTRSLEAQLVAFYTGEPQHREQLVECLRGFVAKSVVPGYFVHLSLIPLTFNGKVDHKALQLSFDELVSGEAESKYVPAGNETESMLVEIWEELLRRSPIGIDDNFFELGGHSLLAIRLMAAVRARSGRELQVRDLFDHPTISSFAVQLDRTDASASTPPLRRQQLPDHIPLSFAQERLWFIDRLQGSPQYHMPWHFRLEGAIDAARLQTAFRGVIERHEVLRTIILQDEENGYQLVRPSGDWQLGIADGGDEDHFRRIEQTPFDLSRDYPLRATLTTMPDDGQMLSIVLHHIAFDAWSAGILLKELIAFYHDPSVVLQPLPVQYADFAVWQRNYLSGALLESKLAYWKERLGDVQPLLLPTDHPRPAEQSIRGAATSATLDGDLHAQLTAVCRSEDVTVFMAALAVFNVLLHRYTGRAEVCVGTPVAGRTRRETEPMVGFFVNTLAINTELPTGISFRALLQQVRRSVIDAYAHSDVPFEKVVEALGLERDMSRNPVFQVMLAVQHATDTLEPSLDDTVMEMVRPAAVTSLFDLTLNVTVGANALGLDLVYCAELFEEATAQRILLHYRRLFDAAIAAPDTPIHELEYLTPEETTFLLKELNDTATPYPTDRTLVDLIAAQAARTPDAIAAEDERSSLTYRQLDELSNRFGHYLRRTGVREETRVPICLDRSVNMIVGILAIVKAGGAYVPLDPGYPIERLRYMLTDMQADLVVTTNAQLALFQGQDLTQVNMNDLEELIADCPDSSVPNDLLPQHAAYMIYTSGSTGQPKGVINEHRGIVNRLLWTQDYFGLTDKDAVLQKTTFCFDVSVWELFWPLIAGARLVFAKPGGHKDSTYLSQIIREARITTVHFVPSMLANFLDDLQPGSDWTLRRILCSGEALQSSHVFSCHEKLPRVPLFNLYGPTEAAVDVTCWDVPADFSGLTVPIGRPVANTELYVLDAHRRLMPFGATGELYIGGVQVARGYHNKPVLNTERFIADPFSTDPNARLYRTGDLVRWLPNGDLSYLGRADDQLKIRGFRIEPGEVEAAVLASKMVDQCVITARRDPQGNLLLVGYIVPAGGFEREEFLLYLRNRLPGHMVPSLLVKLDKLPLTVNGKLDRKALPEPNKSELLTGQYVAPRNRTERQLAAICQEVIRVDQVGVNDNFFEMGGHSIILMQVINRMKRLGYRVQLKDFFVHQTIAELAVAVGEPVEAGELTHDHMLLLHEEKGGAECFIIPGSEGIVNNYDELADAFGRHGYQVHGIQQMGIYTDEMPFDTMSAIVSFNLELIRQVQPHGPYRLIGHSLGGIIVFELMKRLEAAGEEVEFALMLDSNPRNIGFPDQPSAVEYVVNYIYDLLDRYVSGDTCDQWKAEAKELLLSVPMGEMGREATRFVRERVHAAASDIDLDLLNIRIINALHDYHPTGTVSGPAVLLNASEDSRNEEEDVELWRAHIPHVHVARVPGSHATMTHRAFAKHIYSAFREALP